MLEQDYISKILDLEDVIVTKVENYLDSLHFYIEMPVQEHTCPDSAHHISQKLDYPFL